MEMNMGKFSEKLVELLELAKKKKNVLDYQEIMTYFQDTDFEADRMEKVFEILELKKVDVRMNDVPDEDEDIILDDEDEEDEHPLFRVLVGTIRPSIIIPLCPCFGIYNNLT